MNPNAERAVRLSGGRVTLDGDLVIPDGARGLVLFAHGSGSSRRSHRNRHVAQFLNRGGLATLLFDLLTEPEERIDSQTAQLRFDIPFLAERLVQATDAVLLEPGVAGLSLGYFGASTGAAAALIAATARPALVHAVVSRGGRVDLAGSALPQVQAPTLCIVGSLDTEVLALNREAVSHLTCPNRLVVVPGATHLFEEPGTMDQVASAAREWFLQHLGTAG
jgi:putative phosphoribosyl transferase